MAIRNYVLAIVCVASICGAANAQVPESNPILTIQEQSSDYIVTVTDSYPNRLTFLFLGQVEGRWWKNLGLLGGFYFDMIGPRGFPMGVSDSQGDISMAIPKLVGLRGEIPLLAQSVGFHYEVRGVVAPIYEFHYTVSPLVGFTLRP